MNIFHPKNAVVVNAGAFARLPDEQKKALTYAASTAETRGWAMSKVRQLEANETLVKNGMTIHEPDAAMKGAFGKVGTQILELFRGLAKREDRALLIVTHDPKVRAVADRVARIRDGVILN